MRRNKYERKFSPKGPTCDCHGVYLDECPYVIAALRAEIEDEPPHNNGVKGNDDHHET